MALLALLVAFGLSGLFLWLIAAIATQAGIVLYSDWRASLWTIALSPIVIYPLSWSTKLFSKNNGKQFFSLDTWRAIRKAYVPLTITYLILFVLSAAIGPRAIHFYWGILFAVGVIVVPLCFLRYKYNVSEAEISLTGGAVIFLIVTLVLVFRVRDFYWSITLSLLGLIYNQLRFWILKVLQRENGQRFQLGLNMAKDICLLKYQMGVLNGEVCRTEVEERVSELAKEAKALSDELRHKYSDAWDWDWESEMRQGAPDHADYSLSIQNRTADDLRHLRRSDFENLRLKLAKLNEMLIPSEWDIQPRLREPTHVLISVVCGLNLFVISFGGRAGFWPTDLYMWLLSTAARH
jgi:hypothetical protein